MLEKALETLLWAVHLQITPKQGELFRQDGWEPLYRRQKAMHGIH